MPPWFICTKTGRLWHPVFNTVYCQLTISDDRPAEKSLSDHCGTATTIVYRNDISAAKQSTIRHNHIGATDTDSYSVSSSEKTTARHNNVRATNADASTPNKSVESDAAIDKCDIITNEPIVEVREVIVKAIETDAIVEENSVISNAITVVC